MPGSLRAACHFEDVAILNRAVTSSDDNLPSPFVNDYDPARDPNNVGLRSALDVYDRYDLYLSKFGFRTLSSAELGFAPGEVSASETDANLDRNFT